MEKYDLLAQELEQCRTQLTPATTELEKFKKASSGSSDQLEEELKAAQVSEREAKRQHPAGERVFTKVLMEKYDLLAQELEQCRTQLTPATTELEKFKKASSGSSDQLEEELKAAQVSEREAKRQHPAGERVFTKVLMEKYDLLAQELEQCRTQLTPATTELEKFKKASSGSSDQLEEELKAVQVSEREAKRQHAAGERVFTKVLMEKYDLLAQELEQCRTQLTPATTELEKFKKASSGSSDQLEEELKAAQVSEREAKRQHPAGERVFTKVLMEKYDLLAQELEQCRTQLTPATTELEKFKKASSGSSDQLEEELKAVQVSEREAKRQHAAGERVFTKVY
nr:tropomyosin-2-like [Aegilops tauschii subsp. strangulata]